MKIGLVGYGKMGKEIEQIAIQRNHTIELIVDLENRNLVTSIDLEKCDVIIEFTSPHSVIENIHWVLNSKIPLVVGSTGWHNHLNEIKNKFTNEECAMIWGSNFSVGVNLFFALNLYLANTMNNHPEYNPYIHEIHHINKVDAPSGTAVTLGKDIISKINRKSNIVTEKSNNITDLLITSDRVDSVPGTHIVTYQSDIDDISITHVAHNRKGFALGAVLAAEWIIGRKGIYEVKEMFSF